MIRKLVIAATAALLAICGTAQARPALPPPVQVSTLPPGAVAKPVTLERVVFALKEGQYWGVVGYAAICPGFNQDKLSWNSANSELKLDRFRAVVQEEFAAAGFGASGGRDLFDQDQKDGLQLGLRVDDMDAEFCINLYRRTGSVWIKAEWQVYDPLKREVLARIPVTAGGVHKVRTSDDFAGVIFAGVRESTRALLADPTFRQIVLSSPSAAPTMKADLGPITLANSAATPRPISEVTGSVVTILTGSGMGSGFLVSNDGYLITNHHVVGQAATVRIRWSDGFETEGQVIRSDKRRDVALVKTDPHGRAPLALRRDAPAVGDKVFAVGTPLKEALQNTVTQGIVSANRIIDGFAFIQSDVVVDHGNSGGPLLDEKGRVVGITEMFLSDDGTQRGLNGFIPIGDALDFLKLKTG